MEVTVAVSEYCRQTVAMGDSTEVVRVMDKKNSHACKRVEASGPVACPQTGVGDAQHQSVAHAALLKRFDVGQD